MKNKEFFINILIVSSLIFLVAIFNYIDTKKINQTEVDETLTNMQVNYVMAYQYDNPGYVKMAVSIETDIDDNEICCYDNVTYNIDKQKKDLEYHLSCLYKQYQKAKEELKTNLIGKMF